MNIGVDPGRARAEDEAGTALSSREAQAALDLFAQIVAAHPALAADFERLAAQAQGKGTGALDVDREVQLALGLCGPEPRLAIDVGAHRGDYAAGLRRLQPALEVHLFEPASAHRATLAARFGRDPGMVHVPAALAARAGPAVLHADRHGSGLASLTRRRLEHFGIGFDTTEAVEAIRFEDYWLERLDGRPIDLVKVDVEGHELQVLEGFGAALAHTQVVQFEFGGTHIDTRTFFQDFWYFFRDRGFDLHRMAPGGTVAIRSYRETDEAFVPTNYLAVRRAA